MKQSFYNYEIQLKACFETNNLDIMLGREYGGSELSGGQWQKVAIARGIYRKNDIMIMDEPTAAIDPFRENELYQLFDEIAKDTTLVIVTHRLGCTKNVGRVIVMEQGKICEVGSPKELLLKNGKYAEMYRKQQQWYT